VDDETLFGFYDQRIPADVVSGRHFDAWWKKTRRDRPDLLTFDTAMLLTEAAADVRQRDYPDQWRQGGRELPLSYQFEPGTEADGVTVHIPLPVLNQVTADGFEWQIPGLRLELVTALIRSLPKPVRRNFVPVADHARAVLDRIQPGAPLLDALEDELRRMRGVVIRREDWQLDRVPDHLKITYRVVDEQDRPVAEGKDLDALKERLRPKTRTALAKATPGIEKRGLLRWDFGPLPRTVEVVRGEHAVKAYPALVDEGGSVAIRVLDTEAAQQAAMAGGVRRLLLLNTASPVKYIHGRLTNKAKLAFSHNPHGGVAALFDDCIAAAVDKLVAENGGPAWDAESFAALHEAVRAGLNDTALATVTRVERVLAAAHAVSRQLDGVVNKALAPAVADMKAQLAGLVHPGFVTATGWRRLADLPRYLQGIERRLEKLPRDPHRDRLNTVAVQEVQQAYAELRAEVPAGEAVGQIRWMIEELRISLFAQALGTAYPVSEKRIYRAMDEIPS
jgi:ATP-dependent helicase HrpA